MTFTRIASRLVSTRVVGFKCKQYIGMLTLLAGTTLGNSDANSIQGEGGRVEWMEEILQQKITIFASGRFEASTALFSAAHEFVQTVPPLAQ